MASTSQRKTRVFVSFDYDNDRDLKTLLVGQSRHEQSPFDIEDWSIKQETAGWKTDARRRIRRSDVVIVICGHQTHRAAGVAAEVQIAKDKKSATTYLGVVRKGGHVVPVERPGSLTTCAHGRGATCA